MKSVCELSFSHGRKDLYEAKNCTMVTCQDKVFSLFWRGLFCQVPSDWFRGFRPRCTLNAQDQQKDVGVLAI